MRYSVYVNNYLGFSEYKMSNSFRIIIDDFELLTVIYPDDRPSKILSTDPDVVNKFRRKVLKRITEYVDDQRRSYEYRPDDL